MSWISRWQCLRPDLPGVLQEAHEKEFALFPLREVEIIEREELLFPQSSGVKVEILVGVSAKRIIGAFNFWNGDKWTSLLSKPPQWLAYARVGVVVQRKAASWNPATIGNCLLEYRKNYWESPKNVYRVRARSIPPKIQLEKILQDHFPEYLEDWQPELLTLLPP